MQEKTRLGITLMLAGIVGGALGDALLKATPWGLNLFVWIALLIACIKTVLFLDRLELKGGIKWLAVPLLLFAAAVAWRDSPVLKALDLAGVIVIFAMVLMRSQAIEFLAASITDYVFGVMVSLFNSLGGAGYLIGDIQWKEFPRGKLTKHLSPVVKGMTIAIPLLLIFGRLLASADAAFSRMLVHLFDWDFESIAVHCLLTLVIAWPVAGYLRGIVGGKGMEIANIDRPRGLWLGLTETMIVLGTLNILFLSFVVVQFRYFFGGAVRIQSVAGLTYAEYARSGFFELVSVAALILPLLLASHWLLRKENARDERIFRVLAGVLIALLFVMMISALQRMRLYQREYGLTELRIYTTVFMGWLALIFAWFTATVLTGRRERFAFGAVVTGFLTIGVLLAVNPDRLIARVNVGQAIAGRNFDAAYAASLSADALPELISSLPQMNQAQRCELASEILARNSAPKNLDWRRWNWSRAKAARALAANEQELRETCR